MKIKLQEIEFHYKAGDEHWVLSWEYYEIVSEYLVTLYTPQFGELTEAKEWQTNKKPSKTQSLKFIKEFANKEQ